MRAYPGKSYGAVEGEAGSRGALCPTGHPTMNELSYAVWFGRELTTEQRAELDAISARLQVPCRRCGHISERGNHKLPKGYECDELALFGECLEPKGEIDDGTIRTD